MHFVLKESRSKCVLNNSLHSIGTFECTPIFYTRSLKRLNLICDQWRIQYFPDGGGGANHWYWNENLLFSNWIVTGARVARSPRGLVNGDDDSESALFIVSSLLDISSSMLFSLPSWRMLAVSTSSISSVSSSILSSTSTICSSKTVTRASSSAVSFNRISYNRLINW